MVTQYVAACQLEKIPPSSQETVVKANHYNTRLETLLSCRSCSLPFSSFPCSAAITAGTPDYRRGRISIAACMFPALLRSIVIAILLRSNDMKVATWQRAMQNGKPRIVHGI